MYVFWDWSGHNPLSTVVYKPNIILLIIKGKIHDILGKTNADGNNYIKSNKPYSEKISTAAFLSNTDYNTKFIYMCVCIGHKNRKETMRKKE